jgi:ribosome-interacting GTPase 1
MPTNVHPEYVYAEKEYLLAESDEEKLKALEKMISFAPRHKGAENLRAQLKLRYKKLKEKLATEKRSKIASRAGTRGIKKEEMQAAIIGKTGTGKSSLISLLTNAHPEIADYNFTTHAPVVGMMDYKGVGIQLIEVPAIGSEYYDRGIVNSADSILILTTDLSQISEIEKELDKFRGKRIIIFNKTDLLSENEKRKISSTLASKKYNFVLISVKTEEGIEKLKEKLFQSFGKIRIYTKQPGEKQKAEKPIILAPDSIVKDVAEKILKGLSNKIKETKIWGPSSKYPGQVVGLQHKLKDLDVVEFKTK